MQNFKDFITATPRAGCFLGVDWGLHKTGVAVSDSGGEFAFPYSVISMPKIKNANGVKKIPVMDSDFLITELEKIITDKKIVGVFIGLPTYADGTDSDTTKSVREFAKLLGDKINLPIFLLDEVLSSDEASDILGKKNKNNLDAVAATVILQDGLAKILREKNNGN